MSTRQMLVLVLFAMVLLVSAASKPGVQPGAETPPVLGLAGSFSKVDVRRAELVTDAARWEAVWKEHAGDAIEKTAHGFDIVPQVDFARYAVLCLFDGASTNTSGLEVLSTTPGPVMVRVGFVRQSFQTASALGGGGGGGVATRAYGFAIIPRPAADVVVEEKTYALKNAAPTWVERFRLPAPAAPRGPGK
ncbi:MAG: hypothetical protein SFY69_03170 [Planctomycetota bacterium]|nr:hypothetical protein [Planctomycetota bacterium]